LQWGQGKGKERENYISQPPQVDKANRRFLEILKRMGGRRWNGLRDSVRFSIDAEVGFNDFGVLEEFLGGVMETDAAYL
jgi:hypothetical protein